MVRVFIFIAAVQLVLVVLALISALSAERVRALPRAVWVLIILVVPLVGPVAYLLAGRPRTVRHSGTAGATPSRPAAPDDDTDFLRSLNAEQARRDRELLAELERQLRAPDDEDTSPRTAETPRIDETRRRADETRRAEETSRAEEARRAEETRLRAEESLRRDNEDTPPTGV